MDTYYKIGLHAVRKPATLKLKKTSKPVTSVKKIVPPSPQ